MICTHDNMIFVVFGRERDMIECDHDWEIYNKERDGWIIAEECIKCNPGTRSVEL
jgi:hypothetical protein